MRRHGHQNPLNPKARGQAYAPCLTRACRYLSRLSSGAVALKQAMNFSLARLFFQLHPALNDRFQLRLRFT